MKRFRTGLLDPRGRVVGFVECSAAEPEEAATFATSYLSGLLGYTLSPPECLAA